MRKDGMTQGIGRAAVLVAGLLATSCAAPGAPAASADFVGPTWEPVVVVEADAPISADADAELGAWATAPNPVTVPQNHWTESGGGPSGYKHVSAMFGARSLDDSDWDPVEDQFAFGFEYDQTDPDNGHGWEAGFLLAGDDDDVPGGDIATASLMLYGGWRKTFRHDRRGVHPYVGAGVAILSVAEEDDSAFPDDDDDDIAAGAYARLGILFDITSRMRLGIDYRHLFAQDVELFGVDRDADFDQLLFTFGWAF